MCSAEPASQYRVSGVKEKPVIVDLCAEHAEPLKAIVAAAPRRAARTRISTDADIARQRAEYRRRKKQQ